MNKAHKELLKKNFEDAVNAYVDAFLELFELNKRDSWWVCDRIGMDLFCFGDCHAISLDDIIYCVENGVTYDEFLEHEDYCVQCSHFNLPIINLKSWHDGAPRIPQERFDHLNALKKELDDAIKESKQF